MLSNKKLNVVVPELYIRGGKLFYSENKQTRASFYFKGFMNLYKKGTAKP